MTAAEHDQQRDRVRDSLDHEQHPNVYAIRRSHGSPVMRASETVPCPRCERGTWTDSNGAPHRCAFCHGTGRVPAPEDAA